MVARSGVGSAAAHWLGLWVPIPPKVWMSVSCECCVLLGGRSLRRVDHLHRGVLSSVVCLGVIVKPRYEEALVHQELLRHRQRGYE